MVVALHLEIVGRPVMVAGKHMENPLVASLLGLKLKMEVVVAPCDPIEWMIQDFQETGALVDPLDHEVQPPWEVQEAAGYCCKRRREGFAYFQEQQKVGHS